MRDEDRQYFERLESRLDEAFDVAETAKERSGDPQPEVEIPVAKDMADRVENILGIENVAERVRELEGEMSREEAALELAKDFADGNVGDYETRAGKIEGAVRTAVALLTEGVVAAPIEGIDRVELLENDDGTEFVNVYYAGPIRSAGGTAQALSVLVADYTRALIGLGEYEARDDEIERYAEEINLYDSETGLQYSPKDKESKFIAKNMPVMLDGEATGDEEVSGFRDLDRVDTNSARGGMCLVLAEGIALKAPKIQRYTRNLDEVDWPWLQDLIDGSIGKDDGKSEEDDAVADDGDDDDEEEDGERGVEGETDELHGPPRVGEATKFLRDLIAGRPVFTHPSRPGGFRLRYGRARNHGFATAGVQPATMHLVDDFLATGTQIKTERPGKAGGVIPVDTIEGPTVRLANGDVRRIDDTDEALEIRNGVEEILDLGEYLVNYGEFVENNHPLPPASYVFEWWVQDFEHAGADVQAMRDDPHIDLEDPRTEEALEWATEYDAPLHPTFTYLWHDISVSEFEALADAVEAGEVRDERLVLSNTETVRTALEHLLVEHRQGELLEIPEWEALVRSLGFDADRTRTWDALTQEAREWGENEPGDNAVKAVNEVAPFSVRERAPTRIGNRMGRPEKSEKREMSPAVHTLFPLGEAGGDQRDVAKAASHTEGMSGKRGQIEVRIGRRECEDCGTETFKCRCPECGGNSYPVYRCPDCETRVEPDQAGRAECPRCEVPATSVEWQTIEMNDEYRSALESVGERPNVFDTLKGVKGLTSAHKTPEPIEKGVLRAKHDVSAFKDGTIRYDMTDLPVTSVRASELDVEAGQLRALGYDEDIHGEPLRHDDQLVELRVQDIVLSDGAATHLLKTADFVDELLDDYYGLESFYDMDERDDLVGELVFGMAPHTSAAVVGRVIGFTSAAVGYAHPYFHAAKRRNCFHPETKVWYRDEDEEWRYDEIRQLVEERLEEPRTDDFGALVEELDEEILVPSIDETGNVVRKPIEAVSKHPAPNHLVEIETRSGREITVTPDHSMLRWSGNGLEEIEARELEVGASVPGFLGEAGSGFSEEDTSSGAVADGGSFERDEVTRVEIVQSEISNTYCVTVRDTHNLAANGIATKQCDGDEDCVMLLMDGLLNFSKEFLPDKRGGQMDAPLVMSSRIDPSEIDDEAHNMDIVDRYPREFYEATREIADPEDVDITIAEEYLGTDREYTGFRHTHDTSNIALGPDLSAYKTLGSMMDKMNAQLELARKTRAVDETDVAERVIEGHFLPDLIGNLRAFSRQETRCLDCGVKYRRMPLSSDCRECGGRVNLTVHQGSVNKYMDTAIQVADEYDCREYTKQRLRILERSLESVFENDKNKQSGIADFM
ncbi:DNA-directed DNA polymerase II large subunit [Haladaptatus sp. DYF46]|uniref:DNA-directed DNA polymerase II large subunit n=1 Tax=Haladaptatus sp. DYF46 TaxID=2886041 RepID=UPI001E325F87|nr:DNA-directed DNA polymerase II large subunit [Haladaptatus sp. DYF46]